MRMLLYLAWRALGRNRLSLGLLVAAVTAGVGFQIPNAANLNGYTQELLRKGMSRATGHVQITATGSGPLDGSSALVARLRALPFVRAHTVRLVHAGVLFKRGEHQAVRVVGVDPALEGRATDFCRRLAGGRCMTRDQALVLGHSLAERLRVRAGERVKLVLPYESLGELEHSSAWYEVAGVLAPGGDFSTDSDVFVRIELLRRVLDRPDAASSISLYTDDHARAGAHAAQARAALGSAPARVRPWWEVSELVANAIAGNRAIAAISMTMVVIAVMIPVSALLYILVLHERRQIAILGALGFGRAALFGIYVMKAALIGIAGTALGSGVGLAICRYFAARPIFAHNGFEVRPEVDLPTVAIPVAVLFAVTLCAGIVPAVIAARSNAALELREAE